MLGVLLLFSVIVGAGGLVRGAQ
jgi:hypothetical protein